MSTEKTEQRLLDHVSVEAPGEWVLPPVSYVEPGRRFCALCGRPIARRYWQAVSRGERQIYCDPAHAALHATYP